MDIALDSSWADNIAEQAEGHGMRRVVLGSNIGCSLACKSNHAHTDDAFEDINVLLVTNLNVGDFIYCESKYTHRDLPKSDTNSYCMY